ncbi:hypothetical protein EV426DRAFT_668518 [Tirmania nivea]|nr:hypothetical protein EV426DRAFT_668518 [Tirmania nivea]
MASLLHLNPDLRPHHLQSDPETWNPTDVSEFLRDNKEKDVLDEADIHLIRSNKVPGHLFLGHLFLGLIREDLRGDPYKLADGTARAIVKLINCLKQTRAVPGVTVVQVAIPTPLARKRRFEQLNPILNANKKAKTIDGITSTGYCYVTWPNIREIYESITRLMNIEPKEIPPTDLKELHNYLCKASRKFGTITTGKEAKRLHLSAQSLSS